MPTLSPLPLPKIPFDHPAPHEAVQPMQVEPLDLDRLVWDPEYREAMRQRLRKDG